jgi:hypothetical protein
VQDDDGVGALPGDLGGLDPAELAAAEAVAGVGADQQDVHRLAGGGRGQAGHRPLALADQPVGVAVAVQGPGTGQHHYQRQHDGQGPEQVAAAPRAHLGGLAGGLAAGGGAERLEVGPPVVRSLERRRPAVGHGSSKLLLEAGNLA